MGKYSTAIKNTFCYCFLHKIFWTPILLIYYYIHFFMCGGNRAFHAVGSSPLHREESFPKQCV